MKDFQRKEKIEMALGCFVGIPIDAVRLELALGSFLISILIFAVLRQFKLSTKLKISFVYAHLVFLFFPFILFTTNSACGVFCASCYTNLFDLIYLALPSTILISSIAGFFILPSLFIFSNQKREINSGSLFRFIKKYSKIMKIKTPRIYVLDKAKPIAFSFRTFKSAMFFSVGLIDLLNKKEIEAVALHELAHIKQKSSLLKLSFSFMKMFSPLYLFVRFHSGSTDEERLADIFASSVQKTNRYLISAKEKIEGFEKGI